jgi:hypothetical protein
MKKAVLIFPLLVLAAALAPPSAGAAPPERLKSFPEFLAALTAGRSVRAVVHYARCRLVADGKEETAPEAVGGMALSTFEYFAAGSVRNDRAFLTASEAVLISHPRHGYVLNHVKFKFFENGAVEITARYLNPKDYGILMDETFYGAIGDGADGGAVELFAD